MKELLSLPFWQLLVGIVIISIVFPKISFKGFIFQGIISFIFDKIKNINTNFDALEEYIELKFEMKEQVYQNSIAFMEGKNRQIKSMIMNEYADILLNKIYDVAYTVEFLKGKSNLSIEEAKELEKNINRLSRYNFLVDEIESINIRSTDIYKDYSRIIELMLIENLKYTQNFIKSMTVSNEIHDLYEQRKLIKDNHLTTVQSEKIKKRIEELETFFKNYFVNFMHGVMANSSTFIDREYPAELTFLPREELREKNEKSGVTNKIPLLVIDCISYARDSYIEYLFKREAIKLKLKR